MMHCIYIQKILLKLTNETKTGDQNRGLFKGFYSS